MPGLNPDFATPQAGQIHLRIVATSDLHMQLLPYDYYSDAPTTSGGLIHALPHLAALRAGAPNSLLFDNGDLLQGNSMGDLLAQERGPGAGRAHPMIEALSRADYDAATIGNHDFNYGIEFLMRATDAASFPIVLSNVTRTSDGAPLLPPFALLSRSLRDGTGIDHRLRIGVIGFTPPQILQWDQRHLSGKVVVTDIAAEAHRCVPQMRARGADLVVALCHSGIAGETAEPCMENAALPLSAVPGIDAIILGHQHHIFPGPQVSATRMVDPERGRLNGVPAVMPGFWGSHLGVIDLLLERRSSGWQIEAAHARAEPVDPSRPKPSIVDEITNAVAVPHAQTLAAVRRPLGRSAAPIHSYFSLISESPATWLIHMAQRAAVTEALRETPHADLPVLSAASPFKAGGAAGPLHYNDIGQGDLALKHIADLYPYPNTLQVVLVTGAELRLWLERAASHFAVIPEGAQDARLADPSVPLYDLDTIAGVTYQIELSRPSLFAADGSRRNPGPGRIVELAYKGRAIAETDRFALATNTYRTGGGGRFPGAAEWPVIHASQRSNQDVIAEYVVSCGQVDPTPERFWRFAPCGGTSVVFETGPGARGYIRGSEVEEIGLQSTGFLRLRHRL